LEGNGRGIPGQPSVLIVGGSLDGHEVKLSPGSNVIVGSGRLANLRLDHPEIELAHIKIIWDDLGISVVDNGSRKGTWVNGEQVETAGLLDGDTIEFSGPGINLSPPPPKVKLRIPKGSVPDAPPPPPPPPETVGKPAPGPASRPSHALAVGQARDAARRMRSAMRMPDFDWKLVAQGAAGLLALVLAGWLVKRLFFTAPQIDNLEPAQAEMGQEITIIGDRFDGDAADNKVWFGTLPVVPGAATDHSLLVRVPVLPASGPVALSVETSSGRSRPVSLTALAPLRVTAVDPPGALPGDEVVLSGSGFAEGLSVTVGGQAASLLKTEPQAVRFQMPQLAGTPGSVHQVLVAWGGRSASPVQIYLGRLPLVSAVEPARGVAGDLVRVRGAGFSAENSVVTFDGQPALVAAGGASELLVVVPPSSRSEAEALVPVVVNAQGRASSEAPGFTVQRLVEGTWVPRFVAGAVGEGGAAGQATVGTELAPVLLLSSRDESRSTGERALAVAKALDAAVDRACRAGGGLRGARAPGDLRGARRGARPAAEGPAAGRGGLPDATGRARSRGASDCHDARAPLGGAAHRHRGDRDERREAARHGRPRSALERRVHATARGPAVAVRKRCCERARRGRLPGAEADAARGGAPGALNTNGRARGGRRGGAGARRRGSCAARARRGTPRGRP
jgi:hypothetical protein